MARKADKTEKHAREALAKRIQISGALLERMGLSGEAFERIALNALIKSQTEAKPGKPTLADCTSESFDLAIIQCLNAGFAARWQTRRR